MDESEILLDIERILNIYARRRLAGEAVSDQAEPLAIYRAVVKPLIERHRELEARLEAVRTLAISNNDRLLRAARGDSYDV